MPAPSSQLVTLRPDLADSLEQFDLDAAAKGFIATDILMPTEVAEAAGNFGVIPITALLQNRDTSRAAASEYKRGSYQFSPGTYVTKENGWEEVVDDREAKMYMNYFSAEVIATARARDVVLRNLEIRVATLLGTAGNYAGNTNAVAPAWSDEVNGNPVTDIQNAIVNLYNTSGLTANCVVMSWNKYRQVRENQNIIDRIKYSGHDDPKNISEEILAELFDVDEVLIADAIQNTANQGQAASLSPVWTSSNCIVCRRCVTEDFKEPGLGRIFHWSEDGGEIGGIVESYRDEKVRGEVIRCRMDTAEQIIYPQAGWLLTGV